MPPTGFHRASRGGLTDWLHFQFRHPHRASSSPIHSGAVPAGPVARPPRVLTAIWPLQTVGLSPGRCSMRARLRVVLSYKHTPCFQYTALRPAWPPIRLMIPLKTPGCRKGSSTTSSPRGALRPSTSPRHPSPLPHGRVANRGRCIPPPACVANPLADAQSRRRTRSSG